MIRCERSQECFVSPSCNLQQITPTYAASLTHCPAFQALVGSAVAATVLRNREVATAVALRALLVIAECITSEAGARRMMVALAVADT